MSNKDRFEMIEELIEIEYLYPIEGETRKTRTEEYIFNWYGIDHADNKGTPIMKIDKDGCEVTNKLSFRNVEFIRWDEISLDELKRLYNLAINNKKREISPFEKISILSKIKKAYVLEDCRIAIYADEDNTYNKSLYKPSLPFKIEDSLRCSKFIIYYFYEWGYITKIDMEINFHFGYDNLDILYDDIFLPKEGRVKIVWKDEK